MESRKSSSIDTGLTQLYVILYKQNNYEGYGGDKAIQAEKSFFVLT